MQVPQPVSERFPRGVVSVDNPYPNGSEAAKAWDAGFRKAFEAAAPQVKKAVTKRPFQQRPTNNPRLVRGNHSRSDRAR